MAFWRGKEVLNARGAAQEVWTSPGDLAGVVRRGARHGGLNVLWTGDVVAVDAERYWLVEEVL